MCVWGQQPTWGWSQELNWNQNTTFLYENKCKYWWFSARLQYLQCNFEQIRPQGLCAACCHLNCVAYFVCYDLYWFYVVCCDLCCFMIGLLLHGCIANTNDAGSLHWFPSKMLIFFCIMLPGLKRARKLQHQKPSVDKISPQFAMRYRRLSQVNGDSIMCTSPRSTGCPSPLALTPGTDVQGRDFFGGAHRS